MLQVTAVGTVTGIKPLRTQSGQDGVKCKLQCALPNKRWKQTINLVAFATEDQDLVKPGALLKATGGIRARSMIVDEGHDVCWLEILDAKLSPVSPREQGYADGQAGLWTDEVGF